MITTTPPGADKATDERTLFEAAYIAKKQSVWPNRTLDEYDVKSFLKRDANGDYIAAYGEWVGWKLARAALAAGAPVQPESMTEKLQRLQVPKAKHMADLCTAAPDTPAAQGFNPNASCNPTATQCPKCNNDIKLCDAFGGVAPLPAAPALTVKAALQALVDQAQELDMGYGAPLTEQAGELPPLPKMPVAVIGGGNHNERQMREYAEAYARAAIAARQAPAEAAKEPIYVPIAVDSNAEVRGRHPNDKTPPSADCQKALDARGDDRGQGLCSYWKWGFRSGWHARQVGAPDAERDAYRELIYAVAQKFPGETRHQTALRYIREREAPTAAIAQESKQMGSAQATP
jgi:hypothetical protein